MNSFKELSETEAEIMDVLWEAEQSVSFTWLSDYFNTQRNKGWKRQTLSTFLIRLAEKGVVKTIKQGRQMFYRPTMSKKKYESERARGLLDTLYSSSVKNFMAALYDGELLSKKQIDDLKKWLQDK